MLALSRGLLTARDFFCYFDQRALTIPWNLNIPLITLSDFKIFTGFPEIFQNINVMTYLSLTHFHPHKSQYKDGGYL